MVRHEVKVPSLPGGRTELKLVQLSDLHLGTLLGERWLGRRVAEVNALSPDLVVVTGDLVDAEVGPVAPLAPGPALSPAPLGVWGVTGNHEFYAGLERCLAVYEAAGIRTLRDGWAEAAPGLVLTGVDDLTARRQLGLDGRTLDRAFAGVPENAVVVHLSHSPLLVREAAARGARLMLSGHTHGGQLWPFIYLSAIPYPFQAGRYEVDGMTLAVSRGTGNLGAADETLLPFRDRRGHSPHVRGRLVLAGGVALAAGARSPRRPRPFGRPCGSTRPATGCRSSR